MRQNSRPSGADASNVHVFFQTGAASSSCETPSELLVMARTEHREAREISDNSLAQMEAFRKFTSAEDKAVESLTQVAIRGMDVLRDFKEDEFEEWSFVIPYDSFLNDFGNLRWFRSQMPP